MRLTLQKIGFASAFVALGIALTLLGIYLISLNTAPNRADEEIRRYVIDYTAKEQAMLGIDCRNVGAIIRNTLESSGQFIATHRVPGAEWKHLVSQDARARLEDASRIILRCRMLFHSGKNGRINGLESIGFLEDIYADFATIKTALIFGAPAYCNTPTCRDTSFSELKKNHDGLLSRIPR